MITMTSAEAKSQWGTLLETAQSDVVEITCDGQSPAYLVPSSAIGAVLEVQRRRQEVAANYDAWRHRANRTITPEAAALTDEEINRLVHELR